MNSKKCNFLENNKKCSPDSDCYINMPKYSNCWNCYKMYLYMNPHTLYECAKIMGISHTTVAAIEKSALLKLKDLINSDD